VLGEPLPEFSAQGLFERIEPPIDAFKPLVDAFKPLVDAFEPLIDTCELLVDALKPLVDAFKGPSNLDVHRDAPILPSSEAGHSRRVGSCAIADGARRWLRPD